MKATVPFSRVAAAATQPAPWRFTRRAELLWLVAIVLVAAYLRLTDLPAVPPGISHDEAMYGLDARDVLELGVHPIYFERNQGGREPLFIYLGALAMAIIGVDPIAMRAVSVTVGIGTVVAGWALARQLFGSPIALATAAWLAITFWHLVLSRNSFRAVTLPLVLTLAMLVFWIAFKKRSRWAWPVGGALFGLVQYTYFADRAAPLIVLGFVVYLAVTHRSTLREVWRGVSVFVVCAGIVFSPLGAYFVQNPHIFSSRFEQVASVGGEDAQAPDSSFTNIVNALGMFSVRGDYLWGRNIQNKPVFDAIGAVLFYLGVAVALWRWRRPEYALIVIWSVVMIAPTALSTSAPHYLRAVGLLPVIAVFPAIGLWFALRQIAARWPQLASSNAARLVLPVALGGWFVATAATARHDYLEVWAPRTEVYYGFHSDMNAIGRWLNTVPDNPVVALSSEYPDHPSTLLLLRRRDWDIRWFNGAQSILLPAADRDVVFVFPWSARPPDLDTLFARANRVAEQAGPNGTTAFVAYRFSAAEMAALRAQLTGSTPLAIFGESVTLRSTLVGDDAVAGGRLPLMGVWRVEQPPVSHLDLAVFSHLLDLDGRRWGIGDANEVRSGSWRAGDLILGRYDLLVQPDTPSGVYRVAIGWYDRQTGQRLVLPNGESNLFVGQPKIVNPSPVAAPQTLLDAQFADNVRLVGYELGAAECGPGGCRRELRLVWEAPTPPRAAATVFVHVLDRTGAIIAQADGPPARGAQPTDRWLPGERIDDRRSVAIPDGARDIRLGLYDPITGRRLPLVSGGDSVVIPIAP